VFIFPRIFHRWLKQPILVDTPIILPTLFVADVKANYRSVSLLRTS